MELAHLFINLPPELATLLLAMLPIAELRAAIPVALVAYDLPLWSAYLYSVIGNLIPAYLIIWLIGPIAAWCQKNIKFISRLLDWWFNKVYNKFISKYQKYGAVALILFVAIPLPVTGAWTGSVAAWLFKIPRGQSMRYVTLGVLIAGVVVLVLTTGTLAIF